jgi:hypothetical protein
MINARCSCGFTEAGGVDETITDHLLEMFTPVDRVDADGVEHRVTS